jgi:hypothetical protein
MTALRIHHQNLPVEVEEHIEGRVARLGHLQMVIILKQSKQRGPCRPASTIARSAAERLITVAETGRLGSKALVGMPSRSRFFP